MFDFTGIQVAKTAMVAELKQAVEDSFSHLPTKGRGMVSWYVHYAFLSNSLFSKGGGSWVAKAATFGGN